MLKLGPSSIASPAPPHAAVRSLVSDYLALTKPPIILMLLITALGGMFLASEGSPPIRETLLLILGGAAAAAGASAINHYLDRDIDAVMSRTRRRPLPGRRISPSSALTFGISLNVLAFAVLTSGVNLLTASLALSGTLFYVFVYTLWLKRSTPQNIVIGGAAGCVPPLAGWAAATGSLDIPALYLFGIIFFWTPPHFWALALLLREDYAEAGIPMLPVVKGVAFTQRSILLYTAAVVGLSVAFFFTTESLGMVYISAASVLGAAFLSIAWRLVLAGDGTSRTNGMQAARLMYLYSLLYLALIFVAIMADSVVGL